MMISILSQRQIVYLEVALGELYKYEPYCEQRVAIIVAILYLSLFLLTTYFGNYSLLAHLQLSQSYNGFIFLTAQKYHSLFNQSPIAGLSGCFHTLIIANHKGDTCSCPSLLEARTMVYSFFISPLNLVSSNYSTTSVG